MAGKYSRFLRSGFIAVIVATFQLQLFAFSVQVNQTGSVNEDFFSVQVNQIGSVNGTVSLTGGNSTYICLSSGQNTTIKAVPNNGYQFKNWTISVATTAGTQYSLSPTTADYQIKYDDFTTSYGSISIVQCTATFAAKEITVNFDANNINAAVSPTSTNQTFGSNYTNFPTQIEAIGLSFVGWFTKAQGGEEVTSKTVVTDPNEHTLYAHWQARSYMLTFDANNGTPSQSIDPLLVIYGGSYPDLPTPTRVGYNFLGWWTAENGGDEIREGDKVNIRANTTLYAHWEEAEYFLSFSAQGGTLSSSGKILVHYNGKYPPLPTATLPGYDFLGWFTAAEGGEKIEEGSTVTVTKDTTLYARWGAAMYTITFNSNGGTLDGNASCQAKYNGTYPSFPSASRTGYTFLGWYTGSSVGIEIKSGETVKITEDTTLYARWSANTYTLSFNVNGGDSIGDTTKDVTYDGKYPALPSATRTGYTFLGWYTFTSGGAEIKTGETVSITKNTTLYAQWSANTYTLSFNVNGGDSIGDITEDVTYDGKYPSLPQPTRTGHTFVGWYTAKSGGTKIEASSTVSITVNTTLYARWEKASYTLTFDPDGGALEGSESISVSFGGTYPVLPTASRTGYGFCGWYFGRNETEDELRAGDSVNITSNTTVYAGWTNNIYTVVYRRGEAYYGEDFSTNVYYDISFNLAKTPEGFECPGKLFAGWKLPDGTVQAAETEVLNLAASGSVEVIATWSKPTDELNASGICKNLIVTTSAGDQAWTVHEQDGVKCLKSGNVKSTPNAPLKSKLESKLQGGSGKITFKWCYVGDAMIKKGFYIGDPNLKNGKEIDKKEHAEGFGNWKDESFTISKEDFDSSNGCVTWQVSPASGKYEEQTHTLYIKDVVWIPDGYQSESEEFTYTDETGVTRTASVPTSWVDENALLPSGSTDYRAALKALSGKKDSSGAPLSYWHDYIAGTDPKDPADVFKVTAIAITNGTIYLSWSPDLRAAPLPREYQILGKEKLSDPTWAPTNSATRFFRVDVHLKE